jgi:hypothetical protein
VMLRARRVSSSSPLTAPTCAERVRRGRGGVHLLSHCCWLMNVRVTLVVLHDAVRGTGSCTSTCACSQPTPPSRFVTPATHGSRSGGWELAQELVLELVLERRVVLTGAG